MSDRSPISRTLEIEDEDAASRAGRAELLYVALDCANPTSGGARYDISAFDEVAIGRGRARSLEPHPEGGARRRLLQVTDRAVSSMHARLIRDEGALWLEDLGSTNGSRLDGVHVRRARLPDRATIEVGATFLVYQAGAQRPPQIACEVAPSAEKPLGLATLLPDYELSLARLASVAGTNVPVMLLGETGTGKELLARAVHRLSGRRGAFVPVNCGALPEALVEGLLSGHVRGSFSGAAKDELGLVRASHGGTLFLDEIGELPRASQAKLLRVLQEREVLPLGATQPVGVDLRVISATHQVAHGGEDSSLRPDLHARLAGFVLHIPPLRERLADLGLVIAGIATQLEPSPPALELTPALGRALMAHDWPFNGRELHQALSVAAVLAKGQPIDLHHLPTSGRIASGRAALPSRGAPKKLQPMEWASSAPVRASATLPLEDDDGEGLKERLIRCLTQSSGNVSEVSRLMGRSRMQVHRWMQRFGLDPQTFRR